MVKQFEHLEQVSMHYNACLVGAAGMAISPASPAITLSAACFALQVKTSFVERAVALCWWDLFQITCAHLSCYIFLQQMSLQVKENGY